MSQENIDLLTQDLTSVDTSRPLLAPGLVELVVTEVKVEPTKDQQKQNLNIVLKTVNNEKDTKGNVLNAGFTVFKTVSITPTDRYPAERISQELKMVRQAILGNEGKTGTFAPTEQYVGHTVMGRITIRQDAGGNYPDQNEVKLVAS